MGDTKGSPFTWFSGDFSGREASDDFKTLAPDRSADRTSCSADSCPDSFTAPCVFCPMVSLVDDNASTAYKADQINQKKKIAATCKHVVWMHQQISSNPNLGALAIRERRGRRRERSFGRRGASSGFDHVPRKSDPKRITENGCVERREDEREGGEG